jgi:mycothiol synthase
MGHKITVRNCRPEDSSDAAAYERLREGAIFTHLLSKPEYQVERNLFFAGFDEVIAGFIDVIPELGINRAVLDYAVSPPYDIKALLPELIKTGLVRARETGASLAHVGVPFLQTEPVEVLSALGFKLVRRFCDLQLNISDIDLDGADRTDWEYRYFQDNDIQVLSDIQNRCFTDQWGYNPNTVDDTAWQLKVRNNCPQDVILALDKGEVIGYCWTESECGLEPTTGQPKGRIYMLGVDILYRGRGLGRKLLRMGLLHLKKQGRELIEITVDTQNAVAIALYESLGFHICREILWYEKVLAQ